MYGAKYIQSENLWRWLDGTVANDEDLAWSKNEPDKTFSGYHCIEMYSTLYSNDAECAGSYRALCEIRSCSSK